MNGFGQEIQFEPHPHAIIDLLLFLRAMVDKFRPMLLDSLTAKKGIVFLVAVQVLFSHPTKDLEDMAPPYLNAGREP